MKVLVYGSGAREHAICSKILKSKKLNALYYCDTGVFADNNFIIDFIDYDDLAKKAKEIGINLLVIGPEKPLVDGIVDIFLQYGIKCIGANKKWAQLEGSKIFAKEFMINNSIKTAKYCTLNSIDEFDKKIKMFLDPPVIKSDGLASGKGVYLASNFLEAKQIANEFLNGKFNEASKCILLEEKLQGKEYSIFSLYDGKNMVNFDIACDYKKLLENDLGKNTGGMGSACPCVLCDNDKIEIEKYLDTLKNALRRENADFCGVIYSGLMINPDGVHVLEYNMRFGDPEIQSLLLNLDNDLLDVFIKMTDQKLDEVELKFKKEPAYTVVLATDGYPDSPILGAQIEGIDEAKNEGVEIYFSGVKKENEKYYVSGGRVMSVCATGCDARNKVYAAVDKIKFDTKIFRRDIELR